MFTLEQIKSAHSKVKSGADFPKYIQEIKTLGVIHYETFVTDGHTLYKGTGNATLQSDPKYSTLVITENSDKLQFQKELKEHQQGKTNYPTFCEISARLGVEKWVVDLNKMTCTYYDKAGYEMLVEAIPSV
ncbi:MAG: hypothetical protein JWM14_882 [Chitinophagaceae bacterium]|nr:hypothetical protein [Chitinophagaceae bacterium]